MSYRRNAGDAAEERRLEEAMNALRAGAYCSHGYPMAGSSSMAGSRQPAGYIYSKGHAGEMAITSGGYAGGYRVGYGPVTVHVGAPVQVNVLDPAFYRSQFFYDQRAMHRYVLGAQIAWMENEEYEAWFAWQHEMRCAQYSQEEQRFRLEQSLRARRHDITQAKIDAIADRILLLTERLGADRYGRVQEMSSSATATTTMVTQQLRDRVADVVARKHFDATGTRSIDADSMRRGRADDHVRWCAEWYGITADDDDETTYGGSEAYRQRRGSHSMRDEERRPWGIDAGSKRRPALPAPRERHALPAPGPAESSRGDLHSHQYEDEQSLVWQPPPQYAISQQQEIGSVRDGRKNRRKERKRPWQLDETGLHYDPEDDEQLRASYAQYMQQEEDPPKEKKRGKGKGKLTDVPQYEYDGDVMAGTTTTTTTTTTTATTRFGRGGYSRASNMADIDRQMGRLQLEPPKERKSKKDKSKRRAVDHGTVYGQQAVPHSPSASYSDLDQLSDVLPVLEQSEKKKKKQAAQW